MSEQNSVVVPQIRPEEAMEQLGIKKDTYYADLKFLGLKAQRDSEGKSYLDESQFELLKMLRAHVDATGKRDGFVAEVGELAMLDESDLAETVTPEPQAENFDMETLLLEAAELAGHRMTLPNQVVLQLASQMTYEDLPDSVRQKVDSVRAATSPKAQPKAIADQLLQKFRQQRAAAAA
ncbi:hypothetical protein [Sphaerothrix gracilis]|uniref:hypothetical protein n=1 Tax=Sphaerothrix gracilis TaxID=3151835 RepID=UPI0031FD54A7